MALVPIRNIGQHGVNTDVDPLDLHPTQFSMGSNVRFTENKITRGPVFSRIGIDAAHLNPRWTFSYMLNGAVAYLAMNQEGTIASLAPTAPGSPLGYTDVSVVGYTPSSQPMNFTSSMLSNVVYANREDRVPWALTPGTAQFTTLANWDSTWRCQSLRSFNGCLVAINVTKGATSYPTMVKTSDFAPFGSVPGSWNASLTNSATENVLSDIQSPLIDGWPLRDRFILYTNNEVWQMVPTGDSLIYGYSRLFSNYGVISQNCLAEINNLHYVFGDNDIWVHDGFSPKSIAAGRVRKFIYNNMIRSQSYQFFVWTNTKLNEIMFCYVSEDPYCAFPVSDTIGYPGCNRAAVYNYLWDTWTFYDLPYIVGGGLGPMFTSGSSGVTYPDEGALTYDTVSGAYQVTSDVTRFYNLCLGRQGSVSTPRLPLQATGSWSAGTHLYVYETMETPTGVGQLGTVENAPGFLENTQMDMDEIAPEVKGYKVVTSIYPEGRVPNPSNPISFWYGSSDYSGKTPVYGNQMTFDGLTNYKLDFNSPGRYLSMRMAMGPPAQLFTLSGMDIEFKVFGHR